MMIARFLLVAGLLLSLFGSTHHHGTPPFYRVTKAGTTDTSYVFGTLHLLEGGFVDTMTNVMTALRSSDIIVGELVIDSNTAGDAMQELLSGPRLDSVLTPEQYHAVSKALKTYAHMPMFMLNHAQPVVVYTILLAGIYAKEHPENHKTGVPMDLFFEQEAHRLNKQVIGLESAAGQEELLDSIPMREQVKDLMELVSKPREATKNLNTMLQDYQRGNISHILDDPSFGSLSTKEADRLIYDRNRKWLDTLPRMMTGHRLFIAVGAGHLPGTNGLLEGLRRAGFQVDAVAPK